MGSGEVSMRTSKVWSASRSGSAVAPPVAAGRSRVLCPVIASTLLRPSLAKVRITEVEAERRAPAAVRRPCKRAAQAFCFRRSQDRVPDMTIAMLAALAAAIAPGTKAPAFSLESSGGKKVSLADFQGQTLVLAFFSKAFTGG